MTVEVVVAQGLLRQLEAHPPRNSGLRSSCWLPQAPTPKRERLMPPQPATRTVRAPTTIVDGAAAIVVAAAPQALEAGGGASVEAAGALLAEDPSPPLDSPRAPTLAVGAVSSASPRSGRR